MVPPVGGAVKLSVIGGASPGGSVGRVQVTVPLAFAHDQPFPPALTNVVPGGRGSVTLTELALVGPAFATWRGEGAFWLVGTGLGVSDSWIDRSASPMRTVLSDSALLAGLASLVAEATWASFVVLPPFRGARSAILIGGAGPRPSGVRVQVTTPAT